MPKNRKPYLSHCGVYKNHLFIALSYFLQLNILYCYAILVITLRSKDGEKIIHELMVQFIYIFCPLWQDLSLPNFYMLLFCYLTVMKSNNLGLLLLRRHFLPQALLQSMIFSCSRKIRVSCLMIN
jgi:hypothetical protein